ncbi:heme anaerobic degradation radical SAM methyltransferase ChuW/HutW [Agarivorans sp. Z349TD_8]|uniref:heme anaerobic degradation radical SAM methyltransferase ChuW/HutW n=1 Tax=Agarivorans sp. Z349TD_8 TaxID=3421434 RepID=UPI003D7E4149
MTQVNSLSLSSLPEALTGQASPSPLQFAFAKKTTAHAQQNTGAQLSGDTAFNKLFAQLSASPTSQQKRAIYIHIPFCRVRCSFCSFFQYASSPQMMDQYFAVLEQELKAKAAYPWSKAQPFDAVYVGGGTPTDLNSAQLKQLGQLIQHYFPLSSDCEITLEGRLNRFDDDKFSAALAGGFNRFSFGVQSFNSQVRRSAKRLDQRETILQRLQQLSASQQATIAIDLLYGLPHQTTENWQQDLQDVLSSGVHGVDLYQLLTFGGTALQRNSEKEGVAQPLSTSEKALMYRQGHQFFTKQGLKQLSYCHWASDPREQSHYNSLVKQGVDILPIGAGAGGKINGFSMMQFRDIDTWKNAVQENSWAFQTLTPPSQDATLQAAIVSGCDQGELSAAKLPQGAQVFRHCQTLFDAWQKNGLVTQHGQQLNLSLAGQFWSVNLANALKNYLRLYPLAQ